MKLTQVNYAFDPALADPGELLQAYHTLTGWSDAVASAGAQVSVVQRFHSSGSVTRRKESARDAPRPAAASSSVVSYRSSPALTNRKTYTYIV